MIYQRLVRSFAKVEVIIYTVQDGSEVVVGAQVRLNSGHLLSESIPASSSPGYQHLPEKASFLFAADAMPTLNQFEPKTGAATPSTP